MVDDFDEDFFNDDEDKKSKKKTKKKSKRESKGLLSKKTINKLKKNKTKVIFSVIVIIVAIAALIYSNMPEIGKSENKVLAKVNGEEIYSQDLDNAYEMFFMITGYPDQYRQIITKESFLDQLINEELLLQKADGSGISATDVDAEKIFDDIVKNSGITREEILKEVEAIGFDEDDLIAYYKKQLTMTKLVNETVFKDIRVSDSEIEEFYYGNTDMFKAQEGQIHVSHILVETKEEAKEILQELQEGADFKELAMEKSIEPAAQVTGGDLGFFGEGQMVPEFEEAAYNLKVVGQLSGPVETQFGWHIIRKESNTLSLEESEDNIREMVRTQKEQELLKAYVDGLREEATIEIITEENSEEGMIEEIEEEETDDEMDEEVEGIIEEIENEESCIEKYGINEDTIVFYYASWSPRSKAMIPIVNELASEGYDFYMAEIETDNVQIIEDCFSDVISEHIPEFICAGTKSMTVGEMSKESLIKFADLCVG